MFNAIMGTLLVLLSLFVAATTIVTARYFWIGITKNVEETEVELENTNRVVRWVLFTWVWFKVKVDATKNWNLGIPLLTIIVVGVVVLVAVLTDKAWKTITIWILVIGAAIQVIVGTYVLLKMGVRWVRKFFVPVAQVKRMFKGANRYHKKESLKRKEAKEASNNQ